MLSSGEASAGNGLPRQQVITAAVAAIDLKSFIRLM
jgi:hypothetical protein